MPKPSNAAAYLMAAKQRPLQVKTAPYPSVGANEIVIRNAAVAVNPVDRLKQAMGDMMFGWMKYPMILGSDVAGDVVEVGRSVTRYRAGDRVVGHAAGMGKDINNPAHCAYQNYTVLLDHMSAPIPEGITYEQACVIPLGLSTAACGLYQEDQLHLELPSSETKPNSRGAIVIVWGGSTSVGCNAIQLAVASGYTVFTTCSPRNFDMIRKLGASETFDYNDPNIVRSLLKAINSKPIAGGLSIGAGGVESMMDLFPKCKGKKFIAVANYPTPQPPPQSMVLLRTIIFYVSWQVFMSIRKITRGVGWKFIFAGSLVNNGVGRCVYQNWLGKALADGQLVPAPEPVVVGHGLETVQDAFDYQAKGVSAKKVVVAL